MKKLAKISLHNLGQAELAKREENLLRGGYSLPCLCVYGCPCAYAGEQEGPDDDFYGGASNQDDYDARQPADMGLSLTNSEI